MIDAQLVRAMQAFDDQALATLANPGLLRRAQRDLADGKIAVAEAAGNGARLTVDGQQVVIGPDGPAKASCDCPAAGVCRHRIGAVLFLRDQAVGGKAEAAGEPTPAELSDPATIVEAITLAEARKFAGKPGWRAALELLDEVAGVEPQGAAVSIRFSGLEEPVLILPGQGMAGIVSRASKARKQAYHAAALLAARRYYGLPVEAVETEAAEPPRAAATVAAPDPAFLDRVERALEDCARLGFNLAPEPVEESLFELSVSSRADALPRLAAILRAIAAQMRRRRQRSFEFDASRMLELCGIALALCRAVRAVDPADARFPALAGQVRREYEPIGELELLGCGAEIWRTANGARGVSAHFLDLESGRFHTVSLARGAGQDPQFDPRIALRQQSVWQAGPIEQLAHARIFLTGAAVASDGRLSGAAGVRAQILQQDVSPPMAGAVVHDSWSELHDSLAQSLGLGIDAHGHPQLRLLSLARSVRPAFDELAQRLVWPVQDRDGRWLALTLDHDERSGRSIERLEKVVRGNWQGRVLIRAVQTGDRLALAPLTLFGNGAPVDLSVPPANWLRNEPATRLNWLQRLLPGPGQLPPMAQPTASAKALDEAWRHLLDRLEAGGQLARLLDDKRDAHAARLADFGMARLGELLGAANDAGSLFAVAYALLVARQQRVALPLLA